MKRVFTATLVSLIGVGVTGAVAYGMDPLKPPQTGATVPCTPVIGIHQGVLMPRPCVPDVEVPDPPANRVGTVTGVNDPIMLERDVQQIPRDGGMDIDEWGSDQVERPIQAMRGLFQTTVLTQPGLLLPSQRWVLAGWGLSLPFALLLIMLAWLNHARHAFKGTDLSRGRNPFARFGVPAVCLVAVLLVPTAWELLRSTQEYVWSGDGFDRTRADEVLGVILPPAPLVTATGAVIYTPAGSLAPLRAKVGTSFGIGSGLAVIVLGGLGFLSYLIGRVLIILSPIYLAWSAFSHRLEPAFGWLDLALRTNLLLSLFNLAWSFMRYLPGWMAWTLVDSAVFILFVLPALLVAIYFFWLKRVIEVLGDPLMLGGGHVMERLGGLAGGVGKTMVVAGAALGAPVMAVAGGQMASWGSRTVGMGAQALRAASQGETLGAMQGLMANRIRAVSTAGLAQRSAGNVHGAAAETPCWRDGNQYVHVVQGVPTWSPSQPTGTTLVGEWGRGS